MRIIIEIPETSSDRLVSAYKGNDPLLGEYLASLPLAIRDLHQSEEEPKQMRSGSTLRVVEHICCCFHRVAKKLRERREGRSTLEIEDEYDVQDLLNAILVLGFDDVRPEEWTPSYAGGASRIDFLLKQAQTVIEVKKTRKGLGARELGEQLIIDIERYKSHPDCQTLICFVYDPEGRIANPRGIENDLNGQHNGLEVKVIIAP